LPTRAAPRVDDHAIAGVAAAGEPVAVVTAFEAGLVVVIDRERFVTKVAAKKLRAPGLTPWKGEPVSQSVR
jgi:hypothetical protein